MSKRLIRLAIVTAVLLSTARMHPPNLSMTPPFCHASEPLRYLGLSCQPFSPAGRKPLAVLGRPLFGLLIPVDPTRKGMFAHAATIPAVSKVDKTYKRNLQARKEDPDTLPYLPVPDVLDLDAVGPGQTINVDEDILWAAGYTGDVESRRIWFDSLDPYHKAAFGKYLLRDVAKSAWKNAQESPEDADAHKRYLHAMGQYQRAVIFNPSLPHLKPPNFYYEDLELIDSPVDDVDVIQEVEYQAGSSDEDDAHWGGAELHDNKSQYESTTRGALDSKRDVPLAGAVNRKTLEVDESVTSDYHDELGHPPRDPITVRRYYGTEDLAFIPMDTPPLEVFTYIGVRDEAPRTTGPEPTDIPDSSTPNVYGDMKAAENYNQCTNDYTEYDSDYSEDDTSDEDSTTPTMNITNLSPLEKHAICMRKLNLEVLQNYVKANPEDAAARKRLEKSVAVSTPGLLDCNLYWGARYNPHLPPAET